MNQPLGRERADHLVGADIERITAPGRGIDPSLPDELREHRSAWLAWGESFENTTSNVDWDKLAWSVIARRDRLRRRRLVGYAVAGVGVAAAIVVTLALRSPLTDEIPTIARSTTAPLIESRESVGAPPAKSGGANESAGGSEHADMVEGSWKDDVDVAIEDFERQFQQSASLTLSSSDEESLGEQFDSLLRDIQQRF